MDVSVEPAVDARRFVATDQLVWFAEPGPDTAEDRIRAIPEGARFAARVEGEAPGTHAGVYGVFPMTVQVPGPGASGVAVPCAGLTWVGVHPDHRRQGVLTAMVRHHLAQVHADPGTAVSALHASEPAIYGRFGYGLASVELSATLSRGTTLTAPGLEEEAARLRVQLADATAEGLAERMRRCHAEHAGVGEVVGQAVYYDDRARPPTEQQRGNEPWRVLVATRDGADVGWAMFRRTQRWERSRPSGELSVWGLVGGPAARLVLLRRLLDSDLIGSLTVTTGVDDPLVHWAGGPRGTSDLATYDSLWVRLVDLADALQARAWAADCDLVVDVADRQAPWNAGRWRVTTRSGEARVVATRDEPHLSLDVAALGAAYLGGGNLVALQRAGLVTEHRAGAVAELWRAMRADVAPGSAFMF